MYCMVWCIDRVVYIDKMLYNGLPWYWWSEQLNAASCIVPNSAVSCSFCYPHVKLAFSLERPLWRSTVFHCTDLATLHRQLFQPLCLTECCKRWLATDLFLSKYYLSTVNPSLICFKNSHTWAPTGQQPYRLLQRQYKPIHPINNHASCT